MVVSMAQYTLIHIFLMPRSQIQDFAMTWYMTNDECLGLLSKVSKVIPEETLPFSKRQWHSLNQFLIGQT